MESMRAPKLDASILESSEYVGNTNKIPVTGAAYAPDHGDVENSDLTQTDDRRRALKRPVPRAFVEALVGLWADITGAKSYKRHLERTDRIRRVCGQVFLLGNVLFGLVYIGWFCSVINWEVWYVSVPFVLAEIAGLATSTFFAIIIWYPRFHRAEGVTWNHSPSVDIFIPTCGEPASVLERTIAAATRIRYARKRIYVLDDTGTPAVKALTRHFHCSHMIRGERSHAKAGNLNCALAHTDGELILVLDADQVADPDILGRLVNYFKFSDVAFVQSAQRFALPEGDPFGNSDELFYKVMQPGKDNDNAAFSCGSGVVYRRAALESIGGFSTWNLVEDVHTSMRLHANGWKSIYYNHPLTTGSAPTDICSVYKQRQQWATDSLRLLFWDNPFKYRGLSLKQKLQYVQVGFVYLVAGFIMPMYFLIPSWSLLTGKFLANAPVANYALFRGTYFLFTLLALVILEHPADSEKPYQMWAGLFPVFIRATVAALKSKKEKPAYAVNGKMPAKPALKNRLKAISPQLSIIMVTVAAGIYAVLVKTLPIQLLIVNGLWGCWVIWSLSGICGAALRRNSLSPDTSV
jgi:cellulose synthase/poly-beta-1,6-N-acetylglucosamine synthase-like glycosyltransferase